MTGEVEAFGALTTAGLAASTLDRPTRRGSLRDAAVPGDARHACANCAAPLGGDFCYSCGQSAHVHRSLSHAVEEFLHGVWHFDSKAWRTLPLLVFRPGKLTHDYIHGMRARYIAPLALFLFTVFLMFFVFGFVGTPDLGRVMENESVGAQAAVADLKDEVADAEAALAEARREGQAATKIRELETELQAQRVALRVVEAQIGTAKTAPEAAASPKKWSGPAAIADAARKGEINIDSGNAKIDANITKALGNPDFALYKVQQRAYKLSFLLVPLSVPILWLMFFWRRSVRTYDHVVFVLYSLSFMSLLSIVGTLAATVTGTPAVITNRAGWLFLIPPVHMFFQLKGGYRLSTWSALWRVSVLSIAAVVTLALFAAMIVALGLAD